MARDVPSRIVPKFAELAFEFADNYISEETNGRVKLVSVEVFEHGANSAKFKNI